MGKETRMGMMKTLMKLQEMGSKNKIRGRGYHFNLEAAGVRIGMALVGIALRAAPPKIDKLLASSTTYVVRELLSDDILDCRLA